MEHDAAHKAVTALPCAPACRGEHGASLGKTFRYTACWIYHVAAHDSTSWTVSPCPATMLLNPLFTSTSVTMPSHMRHSPFPCSYCDLVMRVSHRMHLCELQRIVRHASCKGDGA